MNDSQAFIAAFAEAQRELVKLRAEKDELRNGLQDLILWAAHSTTDGEQRGHNIGKARALVAKYKSSAA